MVPTTEAVSFLNTFCLRLRVSIGDADADADAHTAQTRSLYAFPAPPLTTHLHLRRYLLANGVAVLVINPRVFDGWNIDLPSWASGEDKPALANLAKEVAAGKFGHLDPDRVAFHGWSGGAQMVSNLAGVWGSGGLEGLGMKAGLMMSGGSQQCYNVPPLASAQCANCNASDACMTKGCSAKNPNGKGSEPCCSMCCPQGETESWYGNYIRDKSFQ